MKYRRKVIIMKLTISAAKEENNITGKNIVNPKRNEITEREI